MTAAESSVLAKKAKCSSLDLSAYPQLEGFTAFFSAAVAQTLLEANGAVLEPAGAQANISEFDVAIAPLPKHSAFYESRTFKDDETVLFSLAPAFIGSLAESLLGGKFAPGDEDAIPSPIDTRLAQPFVQELSAKINAHIASARPTVGREPLQAPHPVGCGDDLKKSGRYGLSFVVTASVRRAESDAAGIVSALFPVSVLEAAGFLDQHRKSFESAQGGGRWRETVEATVNNLEVPLTIVLAKHATRLSDLSRIQVGEIISLDDNAHNELEVVLQTRHGALSIGKARLGAYKNYKAVKLTTDLTVCDA